MYVVMIAMLLHAGNSLLSAWGTYSRNRTVLLISLILRWPGDRPLSLMSHSLLRVVFWCVTVAGVIVICIYGVEESKRLIKELDEVLIGSDVGGRDDQLSHRCSRLSSTSGTTTRGPAGSWLRYRSTWAAVGGRQTGGCKFDVQNINNLLLFSMDFIKVHKEVPFSCRHPVTGKYQISKTSILYKNIFGE